MPRTVSLIQQARIASPCDMKWENMTGDDRVRHCADCNLNVYNFAAMTEDEANELLRTTEGRICGRLWRRADGTVITKDCPVGLRAIRRKMAMTTASVAAAVVALAAALMFGRTRATGNFNGPDSTYAQTRQRMNNWLNGVSPPPPPPGSIVMGDMVCVPPPPPPNPNPDSNSE